MTKAHVQEAEWWEEAIFYAIDVDCFYDGDGDGVGDFAGLAEKIPYLAELGITCIWLLPFYPSGNRDNGYDVINYYQVDPRFGSLEDFIGFVNRAGEHGIRVIVDLVMQHTSDQHPWFLAAKHDEKSMYRNYYFWSFSPDPLPPGHGSVFPGEESTVWTHDDIARAYYHHRFYAFEPGLNTDSPEVRREIRQVMDFWLSFGVDGFRVDAARYMVRLPLSHDPQDIPSHEVLQELYEFAKSRRGSDVMMLGEVDASRDEVGNYFDQQLDTMFDFWLCSYLLLGLATQSAEPVRRGISLEPAPPAGHEWVTMLRNLDEANLEWLPIEERQQVFDAFAPAPEMRIYDRGIRRRLAPMLKGNQAALKLAYTLLFSLPGSPLLAYGDEIGMGEDLSRHGRNAVRLPMQWSAARNGGFSSAAASKLERQPLKDGPYSYKKVNAESQLADKNSLLHHIRTLSRHRRANAIISRRHFEFIDSGNEQVLAHRYRGDRQEIVMLHNLSHRAQTIELQLDPQVTVLRDLFSDTEHSLEKGVLQVSLGAFGFNWLKTPPPTDEG